MSIRRGAAIGLLAALGMAVPALAQANLGGMTAQDLVARCAQRALPPAEREKSCDAAIQAANVPDDLRARLYYYRGLTRLDLRQRPAALGDFDEAIRRDGGFWPAYWVRADLRGRQRDRAGAIEDWSFVIRQQPEATSPLLHRAIMLDYSDRAGDALNDLSSAIALAKTDDEKAGLYFHRAIVREHRHDWPAAIADYNQSLQLKDDFLSAYGRGRVTLLSGNAAGAVADLEKAIAAQPNDGYAILWLYIARSRVAGREAPVLRERRASLDPAKWPTPIIRALLGEVSPAAVTRDGGMQAGWSEADNAAALRCELEFFLGQQHLIRGERDKAAARFEAAIATGIVEYIEYRAAQYELKRIRP
jgi:lipoprotein NlpI